MYTIGCFSIVRRFDDLKLEQVEKLGKFLTKLECL